MSNKHRPLILTLVCILLNTYISYGDIEPVIREDSCGFKVNDSLIIKDSKFPDIKDHKMWGQSSWKEGFVTKRVINKVILSIDENFICYNNPGSFTLPVLDSMSVRITYWDENFNKHVIYRSFLITYDPREHKYHMDKAVFVFYGGHRVKIEVLNIYPAFAPNLCISTEMEIERYYYFDKNFMLSALNLSCILKPATNEIEFSWPKITGAEEYDLEWTFVSDITANNDSQFSTISDVNLHYSFDNDASRITTKQTYFSIDNIYESGYIAYRVRGIGRDTNDIRYRITGAWPRVDYWGGIHPLDIIAFCLAKIHINGHEDSLNWQYSVDFAEEGKHKLVISYFDGSLRNRQTVTKSSTDLRTIVQQTFYDHTGRPAVQILPTPTTDSIISYHKYFNHFSHKDSNNMYYFDSGNCSSIPQPLSTQSGSSRYYSTNNPEKDGFQAYVPDASGYPYSQTEYTPDNTGRIKRQSGVGIYHKLNSGHETKYYYSSPFQFELDRLFATEVGYADHYKKNMVVDPNGQVSVSYINPKGQVIATALAGESPVNLDSLSSNTLRKISTEVLEPKEVTLSGNSVTRLKSFAVSSPSLFKFNYSFYGQAFKDLQCLGDTICYKCVYDIYFSLKNDCGEEMIPNGPYKITAGSIDSSSYCDAQLPHIIISGDTFNVLLDVGAYNLSYSLEVNDAVADMYAERYLQQNKCLKSLDSFYTVVDSTNCSEDPIREFDICEIYKNILIQDVSPSGQYATYEEINDQLSSHDHFSVLNPTSTYYYGNVRNYFDENGDTAFVYIDDIKKKPYELTLQQFIDNWNIGWANSLIAKHPEYCVYERCVKNYLSNRYDQNMLNTDSFHKAYDSGFFKPFNIQYVIPDSMGNDSMVSYIKKSSNYNDPYFNGGNGKLAQIRLRMIKYMSAPDTTLWEIATIIMHKQLDTILNVCNSYSHLFETDSLELYWKIYRGLYLSEKQKLMQNEFEDSCNIEPCIGVIGGSCDTCWKNKKVRFPSPYKMYDINRNNNNRSYLDNYIKVWKLRVKDSLNTVCKSNCEALAGKWISDLYECLEGVDTNIIDSIENGLIEVCTAGCDSFNAFGSVALTGGHHTIHNYQSFTDVLKHFLGAAYDSSVCHSYTIDFPFENGHSFYPDSCKNSYDCILNALIFVCREFRCETTVHTNTDSSNLYNPDKYAKEFQLILNQLIVINKFFTWGYPIQDMGTQKFKGCSQGCNVEYSCDSSAIGKLLDITLEPEADNPNLTSPCHMILKFFSGDSTKLIFSEIDSFNNIIGDGAHGFYITAYRTIFNVTYSFVFRCEKTRCLSFGSLIITKTYITKCPYNKSSIVPFFNYLFTTGAPGLTDAGFISLLCYYLSNVPDTFYLNLDSVTRASKINCDRCIGCDQINNAISDFRKRFPSLSDTMPQYYNWMSNYLNQKFNYNLTFLDYMDMIAKCNDSNKVDSFYTYRLCNEPLFLSAKYYNPCIDNLYYLNHYNSRLAYESYLDSVKIAFKKKYKAKCISSWTGQHLNMAYNDREYHYTLYYYDQAGNLIKTIPPVGVVIIDDTNTWKKIRAYRDAKTFGGSLPTKTYTSHSMSTRYRYNSLSSVYWQSTPDGGTTDFWYDRFNRLKASRNNKQLGLSLHRFSYTKYDILGRIVEVGELSSTVVPTYGILNNYNYPDNWGTAFTQVTKTFYDTIGLPLTNFTQENLRGRVSSSRYYAVSKDYYDYASHYNYDIHGNVKSILQENKDIKLKERSFIRIDYDYDLISGKVNKVFYQTGKNDLFIHEYEYDADNRITAVRTSHDSVIWDRDAKYFYYKHGPLARIELGDLKVQGIDYAYTIQGWLKGINSNVLNASLDMGKDGLYSNINKYVGRDAYGISLGYFANVNDDYTPIGSNVGFEGGLTNSNFLLGAKDLYNGNIRHMVTSIEKFKDTISTVFGSAFHYDQLNRIKGMNSFNDIDTINNVWGNGGPLLIPGYNSSYSYDANGNILGLNRDGKPSLLSMDALHYHYEPGTNKLDYVDDGINSNNYSQDIDNQPTHNYRYDAIGNLVHDSSEGITIDWNVYGKINKVTKDNGHEIKFAYDPTGNRIIKDVNDSIIYYYTRDAQGNIMAVYSEVYNVRPETPSIQKQDKSDFLKELHRILKDNGKDYSVFYNKIIKPVLVDSNHFTTIETYFNADNFNDGTDELLKDCRSESELGRLLNNVIKDEQITLGLPTQHFVTLLKADEMDIYGSSRLGIFNLDTLISTMDYNAVFNPFNKSWCSYQFNTIIPPPTDNNYTRVRGKRQYELTNHLGNVLVTISDRKLPIPDSTGLCVKYFKPDTRSATDYYPFGMGMPNRTWSSGVYRFGFNGKENDNEVKGLGNWQDYGKRMYDPRLCRFPNIDPITKKFPELTPFQFASNSPIMAIDLDGLEMAGPRYSQIFTADQNLTFSVQFPPLIKQVGKIAIINSIKPLIVVPTSVLTPIIGQIIWGSYGKRPMWCNPLTLDNNFNFVKLEEDFNGLTWESGKVVLNSTLSITLAPLPVKGPEELGKFGDILYASFFKKTVEIVVKESLDQISTQNNSGTNTNNTNTTSNNTTSNNTTSSNTTSSNTTSSNTSTPLTTQGKLLPQP